MASSYRDTNISNINGVDFGLLNKISFKLNPFFSAEA